MRSKRVRGFVLGGLFFEERMCVEKNWRLLQKLTLNANPNPYHKHRCGIGGCAANLFAPLRYSPIFAVAVFITPISIHMYCERWPIGYTKYRLVLVSSPVCERRTVVEGIHG